jgi:hypothetical protein
VTLHAWLELAAVTLTWVWLTALVEGYRRLRRALKDLDALLEQRDRPERWDR